MKVISQITSMVGSNRRYLATPILARLGGATFVVVAAIVFYLLFFKDVSGSSISAVGVGAFVASFVAPSLS
ncbi:MAG TPA: hypothetical protein VGY55_23235 [Pirellulales bacterium]|nr:hypothetical protein [Pirellulales bacterium]